MSRLLGWRLGYFLLEARTEQGLPELYHQDLVSCLAWRLVAPVSRQFSAPLHVERHFLFSHYFFPPSSACRPAIYFYSDVAVCQMVGVHQIYHATDVQSLHIKVNVKENKCSFFQLD